MSSLVILFLMAAVIAGDAIRRYYKRQLARKIIQGALCIRQSNRC
jgi:hypothetical protein